MPVLLPIFADNQSCCVRNRTSSLYQYRRQFALAWGRSVLLGAVSLAALALAEPAAGADSTRGIVRKAPRNSGVYYDWTGPYIGINSGYGFGKSQNDVFFSDASSGSPLFATDASSKLDGAIVGAQAGYNWQSGSWLIGLEADIAATTQRATTAYFCPGSSCNPTLAGFDATVGTWHYQNWTGSRRCADAWAR